LRVGLRGNNEEELAKEVLYQQIYAGTPYEHYAVGTVSSLQKITIADVKAFYRTRYAQANLILGIAGGYPAAFLEAVKKDFQALPAGAGPAVGVKPPVPAGHNRLVIIDKDTRAVACSIGFPIAVRRGDPDFPALLVAQSWFGQHRASGGRLFDRMREQRGLNYGDYAYIEYFPNGMFLFDPSPNLARRSQIFQVWIRPVEPPAAKFALRLALYELDRLVREGIPREGFERTREFLGKYVNILTQTKSAELGYRIDSVYYGIPDYNRYIKAALAKLTIEDVNRAVRRHLRADRLAMVAVSKDAAGLKAQLTGDAPSPITYNSPKPAEIAAEDQVVQNFPLRLKPEDVTVVPVGQVFE
jgi:zinc protease